MSKLIRISDELYQKLSSVKSKSYSETIENFIDKSSKSQNIVNRKNFTTNKSYNYFYPIIDCIILLLFVPSLQKLNHRKKLIEELEKNSLERREIINMIKTHPSKGQYTMQMFLEVNSRRTEIIKNLRINSLDRNKIKEGALDNLKNTGWIRHLVNRTGRLDSLMDNRLMYLRNQRLITFTSTKKKNWQGGLYSLSQDIPLIVWTTIFNYSKLKPRRNIVLKPIQNDICNLCLSEITLSN